ncbi:hypothetical protein [Fontibacter flavus]|uniref:Uncharacterized protein n=1 Tax=Fontibacter flavus TaxID=654838 RepID=A0ABV6FW28_9BACT
MKDYFKQIIIKNRVVNELFVNLLRYKNKASIFEIYRRSKLPLLDFKEISKPLKIYPIERIIDNNYYGLSFWLKKYINREENIDFYIEHGLFLGSLVKRDEIIWDSKGIITFSKNRELYIKEKCNKEVIKIGPYIHYADDFLTVDEFNEIKDKLGKILLVIPSHSIKGVNVSFDLNNFKSKIDEIKSDFDTVVVCLYWMDALNIEYVKYYSDLGYRIVSAGNINDFYFLSRLKSIIKISDFVISNNVGTQIGYVTYLGKPQMIFNQEVNFQVFDEREFKQRDYRDYKSMVKEKNEIYRCFNCFSMEITEIQKDCINFYFGLDQIKTGDQLKSLLI